MEEIRDREEREKRAVLVGVRQGGREECFESSMKELESLAKACGIRPVGILTQNMGEPDQTYFIGSGKVYELKEFAELQEADEVIFDDALSPSQMRNLGKVIGVRILDRNHLILDIFAMRAKTREAKLQVETARLQYMLPRLVGLREQLGRQGGTSGSMSNRGAGETKLELDRRKIEHRISELRKELQEIQENRETMRKKRQSSLLPQVALVGYTNAGKSTILNRFLQLYGTNAEKTVFEQDMLFATLETTVRSLEFPDHRDFLIADTVGFIHKLPHGLVKAFQSTLDEVKYADLLIHVVDYSDPDHRRQMEVTRQTLQEIGAAGIPQVLVYNKADLAGESLLPRIQGNRIVMAAGAGEGLMELSEMIQDRLYADSMEYCFLFPYDRGGDASFVMQHTAVEKAEYLPEGIRVKTRCMESVKSRMREYLC